jgi:hypothetical protein
MSRDIDLKANVIMQPSLQTLYEDAAKENTHLAYCPQAHSNSLKYFVFKRLLLLMLTKTPPLQVVLMRAGTQGRAAQSCAFDVSQSKADKRAAC